MPATISRCSRRHRMLVNSPGLLVSVQRLPPSTPSPPWWWTLHSRAPCRRALRNAVLPRASPEWGRPSAAARWPCGSRPAAAAASFAVDNKQRANIFTGLSSSSLLFGTQHHHSVTRSHMTLQTRTDTILVFKTRMWANAQRDGRPAEHRWRLLFNATKFGWRPLLDAVQ